MIVDSAYIDEVDEVLGTPNSMDVRLLNRRISYFTFI